MNTAIPPTPSDRASLSGGVPQASSHSQLKGMIAGLKSKSIAPDDSSSAESNFASLLDRSDDDTNDSPTGMCEQTGRVILSSSTEVSRTILSVALSPVVSGALQIKGIVTDLKPLDTPPVEPTPGGMPIVESVSAETLIPVNTTEPTATLAEEFPATISRHQTQGRGKFKKAPGLGRFLRFCGHQASESIQSMLGRAPVLSGQRPATLPKMIPVAMNASLGEAIGSAAASKEQRWPGLPTFCGDLPGMMIPATPALDIVVAQGDQTSPTTVETEIPAEEMPTIPALVVTQEPTGPMYAFTTPSSEEMAEAPTPTKGDAPAAVIVTPTVLTNVPTLSVPMGTDITQILLELAAALVPSIPTNGESFVKPSVAPFLPLADIPLTQSTPVSVDPKPSHATAGSAAAGLAPALTPGVFNQPTGEVTVEEAERVSRQAIPLALKREIIESISAIMASLLANAWQGAAIAPTQALTAAETGENPGQSTGDATPPSLTVTVKLGAQAPFKIDLPMPIALLSEIHENRTGAPHGETEVGHPGLDHPAVGQTLLGVESTETSERPALTPAQRTIVPREWPGLTSAFNENLPFDFRIQLQTKINTAWESAKLALPADQAELFAFIGEQVAALKNTPFGNLSGVVLQGDHEADIDSGDAPVALMFKVPGMGSIVAQVMTANPATNSSAQKISLRPGLEEKTAGEIGALAGGEHSQEAHAERIFLNTGKQPVKASATNAGIGVAKLNDTMPAPFTSRRVAVDHLEFPSRIIGQELTPGFFGAQPAAVPAAPVAASPAPVLAHRAVETILNVIDAQHHGHSHATSVNLHFKFGGDDLAVRVQMRGGDVQTQFLTDSPDLRAALASEWQVLAGQGNTANLRLLEPSIMPASANVSTGFGSASHGQNQAQQHQQAQQSAAAFPELRARRRSAAEVAPVTEPALRAASAPPNSHHLAALA